MRVHTILCVIMTMLPVVGFAKAQSELADLIQKSFQVGAGGTLVLDAAIGSVDVRTVNGDVATVRVIPQLKTDNVEERARLLANLLVDTTQHGNDVTITAKFRRETPDDERRQVRLRFEISVPHDYNVELSTVGPVTVGDLHGNVKVETGGGDISLGNIEGNVAIASSGGKVKIAGVMDSIRAETDGGSFTAYLSHQPHSQSSVSTAGGAINMRLAQSVGIDLDAVTIDGRVTTDDPLLTEPHTKRNILQTSVNGGGPKLVLRAASGSIHLHTQAAASKSEQQ